MVLQKWWNRVVKKLSSLKVQEAVAHCPWDPFQILPATTLEGNSFHRWTTLFVGGSPFKGGKKKNLPFCYITHQGLYFCPMKQSTITLLCLPLIRYLQNLRIASRSPSSSFAGVPLPLMEHAFVIPSQHLPKTPFYFSRFCLTRSTNILM